MLTDKTDNPSHANTLAALQEDDSMDFRQRRTAVKGGVQTEADTDLVFFKVVSGNMTHHVLRGELHNV